MAHGHYDVKAPEKSVANRNRSTRVMLAHPGYKIVPAKTINPKSEDVITALLDMNRIVLILVIGKYLGEALRDFK